MKNLLLISFIIFLTGCHKKNNRIQSVIQYYDAFNNSNYNQVKSIISDRITLIEGSYTTTYSYKTFHEFFKWDSIFRPKNKIIELEELNNEIIVTVATNSLRFEFLKNNPLTSTYKFSFESGKISKLENLAFIDTDWKIWEKQKNSLLDWIHMYHPELDGFIHDMTMNGAINYLKAIERYKKRSITSLETTAQLPNL